MKSNRRLSRCLLLALLLVLALLFGLNSTEGMALAAESKKEVKIALGV